MDFEKLYSQLNQQQRLAVDTIDGPLLVIAGPGTGKTQLLSARVANILQKTDTLPRNILCLTFTENGAENMRKRLTSFIGQEAYDVTISTYHGLGSDIIHRFPEYFTATQLQNPVDQLGKHQILAACIEGLSYHNPLKQLRHHIGDLMSTISEVKRALLQPASLRAIAHENQSFIKTASIELRPELDQLSAMPRMSLQALPVFESMHHKLLQLRPNKTPASPFGNLAQLATDSLGQALEQCAAQKKSTPLTAWKDSWLAKNEHNRFIYSGQLENLRIAALADVLESYESTLAHQGLYDFDDMIIRAVHALEKHADLKYTLQEQYLYILLDEFQDTNAAQLRLIELLSDNPVHEGRPNVMAVGDDDQAIYAFQGAQYSNMLDFYHMFRDVQVVALRENYRSHPDIIWAASRVSRQIEANLEGQLRGLHKQIDAVRAKPAAHIVRQELVTDVSEYNWIAQQIQALIDGGTDPRQIAVLAPKHRFLEPLVAHLNQLRIPVQYEKRENILESPVIVQLLTMCKLTIALNQADFKTADMLWPEVLSYDFWGFSITDIWRIAWAVHDAHDEATNWTKVLLNEAAFWLPAQLLSGAALRAQSESCETMIDYLIGTQEIPLQTDDQRIVQSPLREYYTNSAVQTDQPSRFYETVTELKVLQTKLREYQTAQNRLLTLPDLLQFVAMYEEADEMLLNTSPYHQQASAVQLMTVFKAKGLEFEHVFLPWCHDDVWGGGSRGKRNNLTLPENLTPIRHAGATDDERLRILYVAITRAKFGLYLTSHSHTFSGKQTKRLRYLDEQTMLDGSVRTNILPERYQTVLQDSGEAPSLEHLELNWRHRHTNALETIELQSLLEPRIQTYQLSPTHLNQFTDINRAGPEEFVLKTLLRFPQAPSVSGQYGNAIHETLEWVQHQAAATGKRPPLVTTLQMFRTFMGTKKLLETQRAQLVERGESALESWLAARGDMLLAPTKAEHDFRTEGVFCGPAHLTGVIDLLEIDNVHKTITVVDYKTGRSHTKWSKSDQTLHKYRQQLYFYKILVEHSHTFAGYTVHSGRLEFIEPDSSGTCVALSLDYTDVELTEFKKLIQSIWAHITTLNFPIIANLDPPVRSVQDFETYLLGTGPDHTSST